MMEHSELITKKIDELIALAESEGEPASRIVLLVLAATRLSGDDVMFAKKVQEYSRDVLLPKVKADKAALVTSQN